MATYYVQYLATASIAVPVDVPDDTAPEDVPDTARELAEQAWQDVSTRLCHQCDRKMDLGDFEPDDSPDGIWAA